MPIRILLISGLLLLASACAVKPAGPPSGNVSCCPLGKLPQNVPLPAKVLSAQKKQIADDTGLIRRKLKNIRRIPALDEKFQRAWLQRQKELENIPRIISPETGQEIERFQSRYRWAIRHGSCFALPKDL